MISVFWNVRFEPDGNALMKRDIEFIAKPYAEVEEFACDVVREIVEDWFKTETWTELIGADQSEDGCHLLIDVSSPAHLAGRYEVDLERVTKARVTRAA